MFQEIGECMTKETDGIIRDSCGPAVFFYFSLLLSDCDALPTLHRAYMSHAQKKKNSRKKMILRGFT